MPVLICHAHSAHEAQARLTGGSWTSEVTVLLGEGGHGRCGRCGQAGVRGVVQSRREEWKQGQVPLLASDGEVT
jgi:hypothetical protein